MFPVPSARARTGAGGADGHPAGSPALLDRGLLSYAALGRRVDRTADAFRRAGVAPGRRVLLSLHNGSTFVVALLAVRALGARAQLVTPRYTSRELVEAVADRPPDFGVTLDARSGPRRALSVPWLTVPELEAVDAGSDPADGRWRPFPTSDGLDPDRAWAELFTSGTMSRPRRVARAVSAFDREASDVAAALGLGPGDRVLSAAPWHHAFGLVHGLLAPLHAGSAILPTGTVLTRETCREAADAGVTVLVAPPPALQALLTILPDRSAWPTLRHVVTAGAVTPVETLRPLGGLGLRVTVVYGLTELGTVTMHDVRDGDPAGFVGLGIPGIDVEVRGATASAAAGSAAEGSGPVWVRKTVPDYLPGSPDDESPSPRILWETGDLGAVLDGGGLRITGRVLPEINVGGEKVSIAEVEDVLARTGLFDEVVVVPVADARFGHVVGAALSVAARPGAPARRLDLEALRAALGAALSLHKWPQRLLVFDGPLPRSGAGKVQRAAIAHEVERRGEPLLVAKRPAPKSSGRPASRPRRARAGGPITV